MLTVATGHGLTIREAQMINLWDTGNSISEIARQMGLRRKTVATRIRDLCFNNGLAAHQRNCAAMRAGSTALLAAILAHSSEAALS